MHRPSIHVNTCILSASVVPCLARIFHTSHCKAACLQVCPSLPSGSRSDFAVCPAQPGNSMEVTEVGGTKERTSVNLWSPSQECCETECGPPVL